MERLLLGEVNKRRANSRMSALRRDHEMFKIAQKHARKNHGCCSSTSRSKPDSGTGGPPRENEESVVQRIVVQWKVDTTMTSLICRNVECIGLAVDINEEKCTVAVAYRKRGQVVKRQSVLYLKGKLSSGDPHAHSQVSRRKLSPSEPRSSRASRASHTELSEHELSNIAMSMFKKLNLARESRKLGPITWDGNMLESARQSSKVSYRSGKAFGINSGNSEETTTVLRINPTKGSLKEQVMTTIFSTLAHNSLASDKFGCIAIFGNIDNLHVTQAFSKTRAH